VCVQSITANVSGDNSLYSIKPKIVIQSQFVYACSILSTQHYTNDINTTHKHTQYLETSNK